MIVVNKEGCIKCGACQGVCPTEAISVTPEDVIFCDLCSGEPKCVAACSTGALKAEEMPIGDTGKTQTRIVFSPSACNQCGDCVDVCPPNVLKMDEGKVQTTMPLHGFCVMCQKCVDVCPVEVIGIEGVKEPKVIEKDITGPIYISGCVGCGMCVEECPVDAITLSETGEVINIDEDACIKCGVCSQTCPWNAVYISGKEPVKRTKDIVAFDLNKDACIGCNVCVEACPGDFIEAKAADLSVELPEICAACGLCAKMCPVEAINLEVELGPAKPASDEGLVRNEELCIFDGSCAPVCPTGAIRVEPGESYEMCTRCGACASTCPTGALRVTQIDKEVNGEIVKRDRIEFSPSICDECGECIEVCPYNMLELTGDKKMPIKGYCVLCEKCVEHCPNTALSIK
ncbi:4Fe-4S binding protein [Methanobacterium sp.]|jgi:ferredoxin|uniref:4Fe-4S binding protein n=1 Tax=Methanobacterium sp. TaxID=2164 RepID=UPI003158CC3D